MPGKFCTDGSHEIATSNETELRARFIDVQPWDLIAPDYIIGTCPRCGATLGIYTDNDEQDIDQLIADSERADEFAGSQGI